MLDDLDIRNEQLRALCVSHVALSSNAMIAPTRGMPVVFKPSSIGAWPAPASHHRSLWLH